MKTQAHACHIGPGPDPEAAFVALFADAEHAFWLDSALTTGRAGGRWSLMGESDSVIAHEVGRDADLLERLGAELTARRVAVPDTPVPFTGGLVGYLGYELKAECGGNAAHVSALPDAVLLRADRVLAYDHHARAWHLVCVGRHDEAARWFDAVATALADIDADTVPPPPATAPAADYELEPDRDPDAYAAAVRACQERIRQGETYEVNLTAELRTADHVDPLDLHRILRRSNPAPYAAFLRVGDVSLVSSSPERFLRIERDRMIESRPIKGTAPRARDPAADRASAEALVASEKDRAENLMIVDLVRSDLGRVCAVGSVTVPGFMEVESYETVHQLVSTVRGRLRDGADAVAAIRACFPPGSMTGAPKLRTMEILDELEGRPRGPYSGALGYLSLDGTADLSVVIRTAVVTPEGTTVGAGGAVVAQSDPEAEHAEMLLKARAVAHAIGAAAGVNPTGRRP